MKNEIISGEAVLDQIEETLDDIEQRLETAVTVTKNNPFVLSGVLLIGVAIGGVVAYKVASKRIETKYEAILQEELDKARTFYKRLAKEDEFQTPESAVEALIPEEAADALLSYKEGPKVAYNRPEKVQETVQVEEKITYYNSTTGVEEPYHGTTQVTNNVFVTAELATGEWDLDTEMANRQENPDKPYVISFEEFGDNENNYEQSTLSYYAEDDTLTDSHDDPIDNTEYTVGDDNLVRFGHGSYDKNVVYIRNERIGTDFEVIKSDGSYHKEVLGLDTPDNTLRHSSRHPNRNATRSTPRRFRGTDE